MNVWVIGRGYPDKKNNMLGSFELEQAKMLARAGAHVTYLVVDIRSVRRIRRFGYYNRSEDGVTIAVYSIPIGPIFTKGKREKIYYRLMGHMTSKIATKNGKPDVIHVHYPSLVPYDVVMKWQDLGTKIVATEHWTEVQNKTLNEKYLKNLKNYVEKADAMCCVGSGLKNSIFDLTGTKNNIYIVPNVVSKIFKPKVAQHKGFRFICSGRLVPVKQFGTIVDSFIDVFHGAEDVSLTMAGNGEEYNKIHEIIISRKAEKQVHMLGGVSREEMAELIASSDALIVFSKLETFCVPVIEAWACGIPVATTATTVFADNPDKRLGIMVDCENPESLKKAMKYLYEHYNEYDANWISKYASTHFSEEAVSRQLLKIYNHVTGDN